MNDLDLLFRLRQDPEMMRFMHDGHLSDLEETRTWLQLNIDLWRDDGYGKFAVDFKETDTCIGWIGVSKPYWFPEMMPTPEIGWFVERARWGQGLASEGATAALRFAFDLGIDRIIGIFHTENIASGRVMDKIGMNFWKEVPHPQFGFPLRTYEVNSTHIPVEEHDQSRDGI